MRNSGFFDRDLPASSYQVGHQAGRLNASSGRGGLPHLTGARRRTRSPARGPRSPDWAISEIARLALADDSRDATGVPRVHVVLDWFDELKERVPVPW